MTTFFWIVGAIGLLLTLFSLFGLGGDHDFDHGFDHDFDHGGADSAEDSGPSLFSYRVIISFMAAFGIGGILASELGGWSAFWSSIAGVVAGIVVALIVWGILKVVFSQQASSIVDFNDAVGLEGIVTVIIMPNSLGEISTVIHGQKKCLMAKADNIVKILPEGAPIKITAINGGVAYVELISK